MAERTARRLLYFEIRTHGERFTWRLCDPDGETIATGEPQLSKQRCVVAIDAVRRYAGGAKLIDNA